MLHHATAGREREVRHCPCFAQRRHAAELSGCGAASQQGGVREDGEDGAVRGDAAKKGGSAAARAIDSLQP